MSTRSAHNTSRCRFMKRALLETFAGAEQAGRVCLSCPDALPQAERKVSNKGVAAIFVLEQVGDHVREIVNARAGKAAFARQPHGFPKVGSPILEKPRGASQHADHPLQEIGDGFTVPR